MYYGQPYYYQPYYNPYDHFYRQQNETNRLLSQFRERHKEIIAELETVGMNRELIDYLLRSIIQYTLQTRHQFSGTLNARTNQLFRSLQTNAPWIFYLMQAYRLSVNQIGRIVRTIIRFTLHPAASTPEGHSPS